jgi:hypothetical protein
MLKKSILYLFLHLFIISILFSQEKAKEYELPDVIEGMNLNVLVNPYLSISKESTDTSVNETNYSFRFTSSVSKWKFTPRYNYVFKAHTQGEVYKSSGDGIVSRFLPKTGEEKFTYTSFGLSYEAAADYVFTDKFYFGVYNNSYFYTNNRSTPGFLTSIYPYLGYGKIVNAFVINEVSNIEEVLKREKYVTDSFNKKNRLQLNVLLDKRNTGEFSSKYKSDAEIEFFTELEKLLLKEKIINKPLDARATMKIYQSLTNGNFILFPVFKGWQINSELELLYRNDKNDTNYYPRAFTFSGIYGLPISNKSSILLSAAVSFPTNSNYNYGNYDFEIHSPVILRTKTQYNSFNQVLLPEYWFFNYWNLYDYKIFGKVNYFHNFSSTVGFSVSLNFVTGKRKQENYFNRILSGEAILKYNIINKLTIESGLYFRALDKYDYSVSFGTFIGYNIF